MARFITVDYWCRDCDTRIYRTLVDATRRDSTPPCDICLEPMREAFLTPPNVTRASYRDGVRREGFKEAADAMRMKALAYQSAPAEREEIKKEVRKMERANGTKVTSND